MANTIKIKRGLKADIAKLTLLPGELGVTLDTQELYVGDANGEKQLIKGAAAGVVESAEKLSTARNISVSGAATGSAAFDGSSDATIALTLANSGVTAGSYNKVTVNAKGLVTSAENTVYTIEDITGLKSALDAKANTADMTTALAGKVDTATLNNYYKKTETYSQSEIDTKIAEKDSLPEQSGNAGKFLTTNGSVASWGTVDLSSKADKSVVEGLSATVATKASNADLEALEKTVEGHTTSIGTLETTVAGKANSADVYTKEQANALLADKADQDTTYTKTEVDNLLGAKADSTSLGTLALKSAVSKTELATPLANDIDAKATTTYVDNQLATKATVSSVTALSETVEGKADAATTIAGYGITDAYTKTEVDGMVAGTFHFRGEKSAYNQLPTDAKEGDVWQVGDKEYAWDGDSWVELGFNVDLSAYAKTADVQATYATITNLNKKANSADVYTKTEADTLLSAKATNADLTALTGRVTTAEGEIDGLQTEVAKKANSSTTLAGYGITNAYTKAEVDTALGKKANSATTLAGYGITDAYTETEVNNLLSPINTTLATKLDGNSIIDGGTF